MRRLGWSALFVAAAALGGCAHNEEGEASTVPVASNEPAPQPQVQPPATPQSGLVLRQQGSYQVPQGKYEVSEGEYFAPQGIYGTRGRIMKEGQVVQKGTYGTFVQPQGTERQPLAVQAQPEGTFYKPFGSSQMANERQPVAGHDAVPSTFFVRDEQGRTWLIHNPTLISRVEQKLSDQGCNPGPVDGKADAQFGKGVMQCQSKAGLQPSGIIDQQTAQALGIDWASLRQHKSD